MTAILRVPGVMFQQRVAPACVLETESATINTCQPALEDQEQPPSVISGAISGAGGALGGACTSFSVGDPPADGGVDNNPDADGDVDEPEDVTELIDVDGDGEPDYEVAEDGDTPEVHDDGEVFDFEDGEVEEDGETTGPCDNSPTISSTASPVDGAPNIPLTPTLDWDAGDLDAGDTLTYRVRLWRTDDPSTALVDETVSDSQYAIPAGILANNQNYSWQIDAWDSCAPTANLISSPVWSFTTAPACAPYSFTDGDFTTGTSNRLMISGSQAYLATVNDWARRYEGDVLPDADGWTRLGTFATPPVSTDGIFSANTMGSNVAGYYLIYDTFNNAVGEVFDFNLRLTGLDDTTAPGASGFQIMTSAGARMMILDFYNDQVCSRYSGDCAPVDTAGFHQYRLTMVGDDFRLYIDSELAIDGAGRSLRDGGGGMYVDFGDFDNNPDSSYDVDHIRYSNDGPDISYESSGTYTSAPLDTGAAANDHEGAAISWSPVSAAGTVTIAVRAADSLADLATAPWSAEMTDNPATIPAGVIGRYLQWRVTLTAPAAPTTPPVIDEVSASQACP